MKLLIYGSKDFGRLIADLAGQCGFEVAGFIDDIASGEKVLGTYESCRDHFPPSKFSVVIAIGYKHLEARWRIFERVRSDGYALPSLIHPKSYVSPQAKVGEGCILMAGSNVDSFAELKPLTVLWPAAVVSHDCSIGPNSFLSPNCTICGFTRVASNCFVGAGAIVSDHVNVLPNSFIKAGTVHR